MPLNDARVASLNLIVISTLLIELINLSKLDTFSTALSIPAASTFVSIEKLTVPSVAAMIYSSIYRMILYLVCCCNALNKLGQVI